LRDSEAKIDFHRIPWERVRIGGMIGRVKRHRLGSQRTIRMLEISPKWREEEWCRKEHIGYVLSGTMHISFKSGKKMSLHVRSRQSFYVPLGLAHKASCRTTTAVFIVDRATGS